MRLRVICPPRRLSLPARGFSFPLCYNDAMSPTNSDPAFLCDAMLGGLARWLRAAGYDAEFVPGIPDADLVSRGMASGRVILSSDSGIFERTVVRRAHATAVFVPRGLDNTAALRFVVK